MSRTDVLTYSAYAALVGLIGISFIYRKEIDTMIEHRKAEAALKYRLANDELQKQIDANNEARDLAPRLAAKASMHDGDPGFSFRDQAQLASDLGCTAVISEGVPRKIDLTGIENLKIGLFSYYPQYDTYGADCVFELEAVRNYVNLAPKSRKAEAENQ